MMVLQETLLYLYQFIPLIELAHLAGLKELLPRHESYHQARCIILIRFPVLNKGILSQQLAYPRRYGSSRNSS